MQRQQDISARISALREDFGVRLSRFDEDRERRRSRTVEDAVQRRENFESRGSDDSLLSKLGDSLAGSISNSISSALARWNWRGCLLGHLENPFNALIEGIKGLFGGGGQDEGDGDTSGTTAVDGTLTIPKENIKLPEGALDLTGKITLALADITAPTEAVDLTGRIGTIEELSEAVKLPPVPGLTGGIGRLVLPPGVDKPIVPGLVGEIAQIQLAEGLTLPTLPALRIPVIYDIPELPEGSVEVGQIDSSQLRRGKHLLLHPPNLSRGSSTLHSTEISQSLSKSLAWSMQICLRFQR